MNAGTRRNIQGIQRSELPSAPKEESLVDILDACEERGETPSLELLHKVGLGDAECQVLSKLERSKDSAVAEAVDDFCTRLQAIASQDYRGYTDFYNALSRVIKKELSSKKRLASEWTQEMNVFPWHTLKFSAGLACRKAYTELLFVEREKLTKEAGEDGVQRDEYLKNLLGDYITKKKMAMDLAETPLRYFSTTVQKTVKEAIFPTSDELSQTKEYHQLSRDLAELLADREDRTMCV